MKVLIGTKNPGKIEGATEAFKNYFDDFEIDGIPVSSDVSEEPVNNEIYEGARNRVNNLMQYALENGIDAEYFLGVESGITNLLGKWVIINIAVIKDKNGYESWGTSPAFPVPDKYIDEIISTDLGKVMDKIFKQNDLRSGKGGISFVTNGIISRIDLTREAFIMALTQHTNQIWNDKKGDNITIKEFSNHDELVDFYISRGIEFNEDKKYFHPPVFSYIAEIDNNFVGAITICKENNDFILDEVAVIKEKENQGICTALVNTAIDRIKQEYEDSKFYLVAKNPDVFKSMGFNVIQRGEAPSFSECFSCPDFQKKCFPEIMVKTLKK